MRKRLNRIREEAKEGIEILSRKLPRIYEALAYDDGPHKKVSRELLIMELPAELNKLMLHGLSNGPTRLADYLPAHVMEEIIGDLSVWIELTGRK